MEDLKQLVPELLVFTGPRVVLLGDVDEGVKLEPGLDQHVGHHVGLGRRVRRLGLGQAQPEVLDRRTELVKLLLVQPTRGSEISIFKFVKST